MERKKDLILECFVLKGKGLDWLAVIYLEETVTLKAFSRVRLDDRSFQIRFLSGTSQSDLSKILAEKFSEAAERCGLSSVHLEYPGGVNERAFIEDLREAQREWRRIKKKSKN